MINYKISEGFSNIRFLKPINGFFKMKNLRISSVKKKFSKIKIFNCVF